ncbi:MAG: M48 family metalloprotease [candidate division Zixibacteria bacterium]|nr:M48 family metalloprotease [candidate division Zixibacteria bacterium]
MLVPGRPFTVSVASNRSDAAGPLPVSSPHPAIRTTAITTQMYFEFTVSHSHLHDQSTLNLSIPQTVSYSKDSSANVSGSMLLTGLAILTIKYLGDARPPADANQNPKGRMMTRVSSIAVNLMVMVLLVACATTGPGGEKSVILLSEEQEKSIGRQVAQEVESQENILQDSLWQSYLTEVGEKIVAVCDRPDLGYRFRVIASDQVNAFAAPGGFIYFYTGILDMMDTEAELAAVMAHEISHVVARHSVKTLQAAYGGIILINLALGKESQELAGQVAGTVLNLALTGYGRSNELQADEYGVHYMVKAGYNPNATVDMFTKLAEASGDQGDRGFFENLTASHPETQERIRKIEAQIAAMDENVQNLPIYPDRYRAMKRRLE